MIDYVYSSHRWSIAQFVHVAKSVAQHSIRFAIYPTNPSMRSFLFYCFKEMLQNEKDGTLSIRNGHNPDVQASVLGHPTLNRKLLARSIVLECRGEGQGRGRRMGGAICVSRSMFLFHYIRFIY